MSPIRSRLARQILAALIALAPLSTRAQLQAAYAPAPGPTLDAARVGLSVAAHATPVPPRIEGAALNRAGNVVAGAVAGALTGWLAYSIGVGALSADHGESYRRGRRRWIIGGAVIGALFGAFISPPPPPGVASS